MSYTPHELLAKIEWAGSVSGLIEDGVLADEVPGEVQEDWEEAERLARDLAALEAAICARLEVSAADREDLLTQEAEGEWDDDEFEEV